MTLTLDEQAQLDQHKQAVEVSLQRCRIDEIAEHMAGPVRYTVHAHRLTVQGIARDLESTLAKLGYRIELP